MTPEQIVTIVVGILNAGAVSGFAWHLIRGLKAKIVALEGTIAAQNKTLEIMERQVAETEKVGRIYKNLFSELPKDIENYKAIISKTKDDVIIELQNANKQKDEKLKELATAENQLEQAASPKGEVALHMETMRFLVEPKHEHFRKFVENTCGDIHAAVVALISTRDFLKFLASEGRTFEIENDKEKFEGLWKFPVPQNRMRSASQSITGWHAVFDDGRIVMSNSERNHFVAVCKALKARLDAHS
jgi:uncharacterized coiled-coil protein SlyX